MYPTAPAGMPPYAAPQGPPVAPNAMPIQPPPVQAPTGGAPPPSVNTDSFSPQGPPVVPNALPGGAELSPTDPNAGMNDLMALLNQAGGPGNQQAGLPGAGQPQGALPEGTPQATPQGGTPGNFAWGEGGAVVAQNRNVGGLGGGSPISMKGLFIGAAALGLGVFALRKRNESQEESTPPDQALQQLKNTLQSDAQDVQDAFNNDEINTEARQEKVNEFRVELKKQVAELKDEKAELLEIENKDALREAFVTLENTVNEEMDQDIGAEDFRATVEQLSETLGHIEELLNVDEVEASTSETSEEVASDEASENEGPEETAIHEKKPD